MLGLAVDSNCGLWLDDFVQMGIAGYEKIASATRSLAGPAHGVGLYAESTHSPALNSGSLQELRT